MVDCLHTRHLAVVQFGEVRPVRIIGLLTDIGHLIAQWVIADGVVELTC